MQTLLSERRDNRGLLTGGAGVMFRNFRYIIWFFVLNLILGWFGIMAFAGQAHGTIDQSLYADRLVHGFDLAVLFVLLAKSEVGSLTVSTVGAHYLCGLFFLSTGTLLS